MVPLVYISILALLVGMVWRIVVDPARPRAAVLPAAVPGRESPGLAALGDTFAMPQVRKHKPLFWVFLMIYHVAFLLLILGHLDILPQINIVPPASRHMLGAGAVGVAVTLPLLYFIVRRFRSPVREISVPGRLPAAAAPALPVPLRRHDELGQLVERARLRHDQAGFRKILRRPGALHLRGSPRGAARIPLSLRRHPRAPGGGLFFILLPFTKIMHTFFSVPINLLRRR